MNYKYILTAILLASLFCGTASAWLSGYDHRMPITVNNGGASELTYYQFNFTNDTNVLVAAGHMQASGADCRITDASDNLIPFWNETPFNAAGTKIWANATTLAVGDNTFYMYYGNAGASSASDGEAAFEFFDDFTATINTSYSMVDYVETIGDKHADQSVGVGYDGTYYTIGDNIGADETLNKWNSDWTLNTSRDCSSDGPSDRSQLCQIYYNSSDDRLYIAGGAYPAGAPDSNSYVSVYFTNLTEDTYHSVGAGHAEGVTFGQGHWWTANYYNNKVYQYDTNWNYVNVFDMEVPVSEYSIHNEAGLWWLGDYLYYGASYGVYVYHWNGTGFEFVETQASFGDQGVCFNADKTQAWWSYSHNDVVAKFDVLNYVYEEDLSKWTTSGDRPIGTNGLDDTTLVISAAEPGNTITSKSYIANGNVAVKTKAKLYGYTSIDFGFSGGEGADSVLLKATGKETEQYMFYVSDGASSSSSTDIAMDTTNYHNYEIIWTSSEAVLSIDDVEEASLTTNLADSPIEVRIGNLATNYHETAYFDWILVRQYADPEPTTTLGAEETGGGGGGAYNITLPLGWSIIGWTSATPTTAHSMGGMIGDNCTFVTERNVTTGEYVTHVMTGPADEDNFAINRGWGYFVKLSAETLWERDS